MKRNKVTLKILCMILGTVLLDSVSELLLKKGLLHTGISTIDSRNILDFIMMSASSGLIWLGVLLQITNLFIWIRVLSRIELSIAFPLGSAGYVCIALLAMLFLHEHIGWGRWFGIGLISLGVYFVSKSSQNEPV